MALIDKASLLMVPSTYEAGKLYNVLPSGNRAPDSTDQNSGYDQTRADFDFDRGSNAAATRIDSNGVLQKYRENVLTYSNNFNQWSVVSVSLTGGQTGYDGSNDAWLFNSSAGYIRNNLSLSGVYTYSIYAKQGTADGIRLRMDAGTDANVYISLTDGSQSFSPSGIDYTATNVGDGWWRISVTQNDSSFSNFRVYAIDASGGSTTGSIYIQNAQVERSLVPTGYLETTTTTTGKAGVLVDLPRINFDANGENGALLLEPSRQQLIQFSEYFGASYWTKSGVSVTSGFTSPEGLSNAYKLVEDTSTGDKNIFTSSISITNSTSYSIHHYIKAGEKEIVGIQDVINSQYWASIDLINGVVLDEKTSGSTKVEPLINGYYKISYPFTSNTTSIRPSIFLLPDSYTTGRPSDQDYTGDGTSGVYIFGAQLEAGSYSTSYIPNHGESGGVTRAADSCSVTGASDVIGQTEGTLFVEAETLENGADCRITLSDNTINNRVSIEWDANADTIKGFIGVGGNLATTSYDQTNRNKIAIVYNSTDARLFINGTKVMTDTSVPSLSGMDRIEFANFGGPLPFVGKVYKMYVSKEKLTDAECETLTTL